MINHYLKEQTDEHLILKSGCSISIIPEHIRPVGVDSPPNKLTGNSIPYGLWVRTCEKQVITRLIPLSTKAQPCCTPHCLILSPVESLFWIVSHTINANRGTPCLNHTLLVHFFFLTSNLLPCSWSWVSVLVNLRFMPPWKPILSQALIRHRFSLYFSM